MPRRFLYSRPFFADVRKPAARLRSRFTAGTAVSCLVKNVGVYICFRRRLCRVLLFVCCLLSSPCPSYFIIACHRIARGNTRTLLRRRDASSTVPVPTCSERFNVESRYNRTAERAARVVFEDLVVIQYFYDACSGGCFLGDAKNIILVQSNVVQK